MGAVFGGAESVELLGVFPPEGFDGAGWLRSFSRAACSFHDSSTFLSTKRISLSLITDTNSGYKKEVPGRVGNFFGREPQQVSRDIVSR